MNVLIDGQTLETDEINRGIGVYFKNVLCNMVKNTVGIVWYITASDKDSKNKIDIWTANRLNWIIDDIFRPSTEYCRGDQFADKVNEIIDEYHIHCFWCPNPLMMNVIFPKKKIKCKFFATIYDLIPYIMPIKSWDKFVTEEYMRRIEYLKEERLLCISEATKHDVQEVMGVQTLTYVTLAAANDKLFYRKRDFLNSSKEAIIMYTGGFDPRKNIYGAVEAFSRIKNKITDLNLKLYIVCKYAQREKDELDKKLKELKVCEDVIVTGYISDNDLAGLYQKADVFFFPSFYEGFGLPLLEAMLGGAYILSADNSSLPEVCGKYALYCNAYDINDMAEKLVAAIKNSLAEGLEEKRMRQNYALQFTWRQAADNTCKAFQTVINNVPNKRQKIAMVTPWPKQQTGIANYVYKLMPFLNKFFDVDIFVDNTLDSECELLPNIYGNRFLIRELDEKYKLYDNIIYQIGNSTIFHSEIYRKFKKINGIAEIHDIILSAFFYHSYYTKGEKDTYYQAVIDGYGEEGKHYYEELENKKRSSDDAVTYPMGCAISSVAKKTIVHNEWSYRKLYKTGRLFCIPHPSFENDTLSLNTRRKAEAIIRKIIDFKEGEILIGCFGWLNQNKRPDVVLRSVLMLKDMGYPVKLVFFGECNFPEFENLIKNNWFKECVKISGYLEREEYQIAMELCDMVINLRYPSMGEASGTLCEAFKMGKPVIVTACNQYLEYPDDVCWKLPLEDNEIETLTELLYYLLENKEVRERLGKNAKEYADNLISGENIANLYLQVLQEDI